MVIQGSLRFLGGGELVGITTCSALLRAGYKVALVSDRFQSKEVDSAFGMGEVLMKCEKLMVPALGRRVFRFSPTLALPLVERFKRHLESVKADVVIVTRDLPRPYVLPGRPLLRFMYEMSQLRPFWEDYPQRLKSKWQNRYRPDYSETTFLSLSSALVRELEQNGHPGAELVYPSYGIGFHPRPKKNQVVYVTFLAPQKRLEHFLEVARKVPKYRFYIVGRDTKDFDRFYGGYAHRVLANLPDNVEYIEGRIRDMPQLLEESRIYLHTSIEPGVGMAVIEALTAGCMPVAPSEGGAGEVLRAARVGHTYDKIDDAASFIESEMENKDSNLSPETISEKATVFSPEAFQQRIIDVIQKTSVSH